MQIVTPSFSASGVMRLSPLTQFSSPSPSDIPARLPENTIMLGSPAAATSGSRRSLSATRRSCSFGRLKPIAIVDGPLAIAHVSPCCFTVGQSFSPRSSTD